MDTRNSDTLVESVYDAAENPAQWHRVADGFARLLDADHATIILEDRGAVGTAVIGATCPARIAEYAGHYQSIDPFAEPALISRMSAARRAFVSHELVEDRALRESTFYNDYWRRWGNLFWACGGYYALADGLRVKISAQRTKAHGQFDELDRRKADELIPHVLRAALLGSRLGMLRLQASVRDEMHDQLLDAMLVIEGNDRIVSCNARARELFNGAAGDAVLPLRALRLVNASEQQRLVDAIARARLGTTVPLPEALRLERSAPLPALFVLIVAGTSHALPGTVQLFIRDPRWHKLVPDQALASLFRLTPAQSRICGLLIQGEPPEAIAEIFQVRISTVRSQIKQAMEKVGVHRQVELVRMLCQALPALKQSPAASP